MKSKEFQRLRQLVANPSEGLNNEIVVAGTLLQQYDEIITELNEIDFKEAKAKYESILGSREISLLTISELDQMIGPASLMGDWRELSRIKQETVWTLQALYYLIQHSTKTTILKDLKSADWFTRHQILTRWAWMQIQKELKTKKGKVFNSLYLCEVGPAIGRQKEDREFYCLLKFMPSYCTHRQCEYLFDEKGERPDFIVVDAENKRMGIEISEAPSDGKFNFELTKREEFYNALLSKFQALHFLVTIWVRSEWSILVKDLNEIINWLVVLFERLQNTPPAKDQRYSHRDITVSIKKSDFGFLIQDWSNDGSGLPSFGTGTKRFAEVIYSRIQDKLRRGKPQISPCVLVIYANTSISSPDYDKVKSIINSQLALDFKTHFNEIWIMDEKIIMQLS